MILNRRDALGGTASAALVAGLAVLGNLALQLLDIDQGGAAELRDPAFAPPGWVIGAVWVVLFALLGLARWAAVARDGAGPRAELALWALIALCLLYPYYTNSFSVWPAFLGAMVACVAAAAVALGLRRRSRRAALLLLPLIGWTAFASLLTATKIAIN